MIRAATLGDASALEVLHRASILELCKSHYTDEQLMHWTSALRAEIYAGLLDTHEVLVDERDREVCGFGVLDARNNLINATYVGPRAVRQGVGRALMTAMEESARAQRTPHLFLYATLNAVPFYEKLGYAQGAATMNRLPSGIELPCVRMHKDLLAP